MTTPARNRPVTARGVLFPQQARGSGSTRLAEALRRREVAEEAMPDLPDMARSALGLVAEEIGDVTEQLLDVDLGDALVAGWKKYAALRDSARRTLAAPGSEEVVVLARHRISSSYEPSVDLVVDGVRVNTFEFDLAVEFDLTGVTAVVSGGALVALQGGECVVTASLSLEGARLARREKKVDLEIVLPLGRPVVLVDEAAS